METNEKGNVMLILTRKQGERIAVTNGTETIEVYLQKLKGKKVSIGIKASQNFRITRPKDDE